MSLVDHPELDGHYDDVLDSLRYDSVVPLLGAGANLCSRGEHERWEPGNGLLPSGAELARHLAEAFRYPEGENADDLLRVAQFVQARRGDGPLYNHLHRIFAAAYRPTLLHRFLASLPRRLEDAGHGRRHQLIMTTNYDDALEQAFDDAGETYDVVYYRLGRSEGRHVANCWHRPPGGEPICIRQPRRYMDLDVERRTVILKVHGAVDRDETTARNDCYVISEDHYIEFLNRLSLSDVVPAPLLATLCDSNFLFLGYRLQDWNLRVVLHQIWTRRDRRYDSWAIQLDVDTVDRTLWDARGVRLLEVPLSDYVAELEERLEGVAT